MGSLTRKIEREQEKKAYQRFSRAWKNERAFQRYETARGEKLETPPLGRRPTFSMWKKAMENKEAALAAKKIDETVKEAEKKDLSWDDEEIPTLGEEDKKENPPVCNGDTMNR